MAAERQIRIVVGILGALGAAFALTRFGAPPKAALETRLLYEAAWWSATAPMMLYAKFVDGCSMGLRMPSWRDAVIALGAGLLVIVGTVFVYMVLFPVLLLSISSSHVPNTMLMPHWYRLIMVARMAVAGELLFRAIPVERGAALIPRGGQWITAAISLALFIAANWSSWSPVEAIATFFSGIVLTALYLWRRNLVVNAIASFMALGAGYLGS